jgi:hypothetical protein
MSYVAEWMTRKDPRGIQAAIGKFLNRLSWRNGQISTHALHLMTKLNSCDAENVGNPRAR